MSQANYQQHPDIHTPHHFREKGNAGGYVKPSPSEIQKTQRLEEIEEHEPSVYMGRSTTHPGEVACHHGFWETSYHDSKNGPREYTDEGMRGWRSAANDNLPIHNDPISKGVSGKGKLGAGEYAKREYEGIPKFHVHEDEYAGQISDYGKALSEEYGPKIVSLSQQRISKVAQGKGKTIDDVVLSGPFAKAA